MNLTQIEDEFFGVFLQKDPRTIFAKKADSKMNAEITTVQLRLKEVGEHISSLVAVKMNVPELTAQLATLTKERDSLNQKLDTLTLKKNEIENSVENFTNFKKLYDAIAKTEIKDKDLTAFHSAIDNMREHLKNPTLRKQLQVMLPNSISKIVFNSTRNEWEAFSVGGKSIYRSMVA